MTLTMPIGKVNLPTAIKNQPNGAVDPALLSQVEPDRPSMVYKMADLPARSMRAWHAAAAAVGIVLTTTGRGRTLGQQWSIFGGSEARYRPVTLAEFNAAPAANRKQWPINDYTSSAGQPAPGRASVARMLGVTIPNSNYWIKIKLANGSYPATAAVPGTSNHGFWCADDLAEIVDGKVISLRASTVQWLYATGHLYGFVWETPSENWHVDWGNGDVLTAATIAFEKGPEHPAPEPHPEPTPDPGPAPTPVDSDYMIVVFHLTDAAAQFLALAVKNSKGQIVAIQVEWTGDGTDPAVQQRMKNQYDAGAIDAPGATTNDFKSCTLIGPLPKNDPQHVWTGAEFARWDKNAVWNR